MKQVVFSIVGSAVALVVVLILLSIHSRDIRQVELERNLDSAASQSLKNACVTQNTKIGDNDALVADFISNFLGRMKSDGKDIEIDIVAADIYKGILSANVRENYRHPNGKPGTITASTTSIVERESRRPTIAAKYYLPWEVARDCGFDYREGEDFLYYTKRYSKGADPEFTVNTPVSSKNTFVSWRLISESRNGNRKYIGVYE